jgi:hypothetical protein
MLLYKTGGMKYLLIIFVFFIIIFSCEDTTQEFCWDCLITDYDYYIKMDQEPTLKHYNDSTIICKRTEFEILLYEKDHTIYPFSITTGGTHLKWATCRCTKNE